MFYRYVVLIMILLILCIPFITFREKSSVAAETKEAAIADAEVVL